MIFQHTWEQVLDQTKTQTRRVIKPDERAIRGKYNRITGVQCGGRWKWQVGACYAVQTGRGQPTIARIRLLRINSEYIMRVSATDALAEGFANRQAFLHTWQTIHGQDAFNCRVWVLHFALEGLVWDIASPILKPIEAPQFPYARS